MRKKKKTVGGEARVHSNKPGNQTSVKETKTGLVKLESVINSPKNGGDGRRGLAKSRLY